MTGRLLGGAVTEGDGLGGVLVGVGVTVGLVLAAVDGVGVGEFMLFEF
ncbi:MAG: hypothetical protein WKF71_00970 [Pyrinomonadaceae bacterium]